MATTPAEVPEWFSKLSWSTPLEIPRVRIARDLLPSRPGVYAFTNHDQALVKGIGHLYVGKTDRSLRERVGCYLGDPNDVEVAKLRHAGKAQVLMELNSNGGRGMWVRWTFHAAPARLEDELIEYLQPGFNSSGVRFSASPGRRP